MWRCRRGGGDRLALEVAAKMAVASTPEVLADFVAPTALIGQHPRGATRSKAPLRAARADRANDAVHHVQRDYRDAMAELLQDDDLRVVVAGQALYRHYLAVADAIIAVADRLWFAVLRGA
jgi:hypothetical protein